MHLSRSVYIVFSTKLSMTLLTPKNDKYAPPVRGSFVTVSYFKPDENLDLIFLKLEMSYYITYKNFLMKESR